MKKLVVLLVVVFSVSVAVAQDAGQIAGIWWNEEKTSKIEVVEQDGQYIGQIIYLVPEKYENGQAPKDTENPDAGLRERSLVGIRILKGLTFNAKKKEWEGGQIYDPKSGKTYDCYAWFEDSPDKLFLKGYVAGVKWLGRSTEWTRTGLN
jgi:uncharacterized protein (DUF2147 family)